MEWDRIETFLAVAQHGGFSAAARAVGKTQSAMSQAVALLEQELGQPLLIRKRRGTALTEAGRILLEHAQAARAQLSIAQKRLSALAPLEGGRLTIGTSDTLGYYYLPAALSAFRGRHPHVEVHLTTAPSPRIAAAVAQHEVDVGVVSLPLTDSLRGGRRALLSELSLQPLGDEPDVLIVHPEHALAERGRVAFAALAQEDLLLLGRETAGRAVLDRAFERLEIKPNVRMEMNSVELLKRMVELGFGAAVVPRMAVQREVESDRLRALTIEDAPGTRSVGLALPRAAPLSHAAETFASLVRDVASAGHGAGAGFGVDERGG